MKLSFITILLCTAVAVTSFNIQNAESQSEDSPRLRFAEDRILDRLNRIEKQLIDMERTFYQEEEKNENAPAPNENTSQLVIRMEQIEDQLKRLTGKLEEFEHTLSKRPEPAQAQATPPQQETIVVNQPSVKTNEAPASMNENRNKVFQKVEAPEPEEVTEQVNKATTSPKPNIVTKTLSTREEYDAAFALVTADKYDEAIAALLTFIEKHPNQHLTENAHYWLAESYFAKSDYEQAAVEFLRGYQAHPLGAKAPDNLLKLAISLGEIDKITEACGSLDKLHSEFPNASLAIKQRSNKEYSKLDCS